MSKKPTPKNRDIQMSERPDISIEQSANDVVQRLTAIGKLIDFELPESIEEIERDAVEEENRSAVSDAKQGMRLMAIKASGKHGDFGRWLDEKGINRRRAWEKMKVTQMLLDLPSDATASLINLGSSKLITLAKLPIETIEDVAAKGELEELDEMSVRELKAYARKMENKALNAETELGSLQEKNKALIKQRDQALPETNFPEFVTVIRHESHALAQKSLLCIDSLEQMLNEHMALLHGGGKSKEWHKGADIAVASMYLQVQNIAARAAGLTLRMRAELSCDTMDTQSVDLRFNPSEIAAAQRDYDMMVLQHKTEEAGRIMERHRAKPARPGRPVGSTTKNKPKAKGRK